MWEGQRVVAHAEVVHQDALMGDISSPLGHQALHNATKPKGGFGILGILSLAISLLDHFLHEHLMLGWHPLLLGLLVG